MERLTKRDADGQAVIDCQKCEADWTGKHGKPMVDCTALYCRNRLKDRLAAYEDTGLTPGEIKSMKDEHFSGLEMAKLHSALMELKKYQEADKDGRLVVLPCKVGDTVYRLQYVEESPGRFIVDAVPIKFALIWIDEFGKTVFLTREEAEKALEAMKDG
jgi:hypothetical protein